MLLAPNHRRLHPLVPPWGNAMNTTYQPGPSGSLVLPTLASSAHTTQHLTLDDPPLLPAYVSRGQRETNRPPHVSASSASCVTQGRWHLPTRFSPACTKRLHPRQQFDPTLVK